MTTSDDDFASALAHWQAGQLPEAEQALQRLLAHTPEHAHGLQLLGAVFGSQGRAAEALAPLQRAAELQPDSASAHHNLGNVLAMLGRREDALASLGRSLALVGANPAALMTQARTLMELQRPVEALQGVDLALSLEPQWALAWQCRGDVLGLLSGMGMNRRDDAIEAYRRARALGGDAEELDFCLAAIGAAPAPTAAPAQVVSSLFDTYAPNFEQHLQALHYRTPQHIAQVLQQACVGSAQSPLAEVWDLGCGTGLCAPLLRPLAQRLVGVDLSTGMLDRAHARDTYDALQCADIVDALLGRVADIDLLVAADVFVYIGDLRAMFGAARRVLRPGGHFVFSIEALEGRLLETAVAPALGPALEPALEPGYRLQPTRRYAHSIGYIEGLAAVHGLKVRAREPGVLRENAGLDVDGWVLLLQRQG